MEKVRKKKGKYRLLMTDIDLERLCEQGNF